MFDGNNQDFVKQRANEQITDPKLGTVVEVYEHINEDDNSNFECDVFVDGDIFEERAIPYMGGHRDQISPPMVGDTVLVVFREGVNSRPILLGSGYTNRDRAPVARAGMYRDVYTSWLPEEKDDEGNITQQEVSGVAGRGDIKVTGYTKYDQNPAQTDKSELVPEWSRYQISKERQTPDTSDPQAAPMTIEMYDSPADNEAHVTVSINKAGGSDTAGTWGLKFDVANGSFKIVDSSGYGIESDGNGNFTWNYETINYSEGTTDFL